MSSEFTFSRCFGPPEVTKVGSQGTGTHFVILITIGEDGHVVPADHRLALRNRANQLWHTDSSFKKVPALTSVLSARIIPARGGETEFVSTRIAFERLERDCARSSRIPLFGTTMRIPAAKSPQTSQAPKSARPFPAMLAYGVEEPSQRPQRALSRLSCLCNRGQWN